MELQWPLIIFTLFVCLSAGTFGIQGLLAYLGKGEKVQYPALFTATAAIAVGGIASFLHLQHWDRIFNGFGHLTSGITQEMIAIVIFGIGLIVYFIVLRKAEDGKLPKWCGVLAMVVSVLLVFVMAHSYAMPARAAWDTPLLIVYYLSNAIFLGALTVMLIAGVRNAADKVLAKVTLGGGIFQAIMSIIYVIYFAVAQSSFVQVGYYFDPTHPTQTLMNPTQDFAVLMGSNAPLFWIGEVIVGLLIPLAILFVLRKSEGKKNDAAFISVALIAALIGGICFRCLLYILGYSTFMFY